MTATALDRRLLELLLARVGIVERFTVGICAERTTWRGGRVPRPTPAVGTESLRRASIIVGLLVPVRSGAGIAAVDLSAVTRSCHSVNVPAFIRAASKGPAPDTIRCSGRRQDRKRKKNCRISHESPFVERTILTPIFFRLQNDNGSTVFAGVQNRHRALRAAA